jgi:hypothetical protein
MSLVMLKAILIGFLGFVVKIVHSLFGIDMVRSGYSLGVFCLFRLSRSLDLSTRLACGILAVQEFRGR